MRSPIRVLLSLILVVPAVLSLGCVRRTGIQQTLRSQAVQAPQGSPVLLAAYQPWFGRPGHISVGYNSQDRVVLARQIQDARNMGIKGFVVNWYGPRHEFEDRAYGTLQQVAAGNGFQVALMYDEDADDPGESTDKAIVDLQYGYDRYISPHADPSRTAYLRYNGRPVIFIFPKGGNTDWNRVRRLVSSWEDPPLLIMKDIDTGYAGAFDGFYAWVQPGDKGWKRDGGNWGRDYLESFYQRMTARHPDKIAVGAAWPGFNDTRASWSRNRFMSCRGGKTFEESLRLFRRYYSNERPLPFLLIVTWNDYEEGTAIERGYAECGAGSREPTSGSASQ